MEIPVPVIYTALGGGAIQILAVIDGINAPKDRKPDFKAISYYIALLLNISLSVILGLVYFDETTKFAKIVYFHVGASAPLILRTLATTVPEIVRKAQNASNNRT